MEPEKKRKEKAVHSFVLRVDTELWDRFLQILPLSVSINESIVQLIYKYVCEYERVLDETREIAGLKDK